MGHAYGLPHSVVPGGWEYSHAYDILAAPSGNCGSWWDASGFNPRLAASSLLINTVAAAPSEIFDDEAAKPDRIVHPVSPREVYAWREAVPELQVTRRLYRGMCEHNAHVEAALATFRIGSPRSRASARKADSASGSNNGGAPPSSSMLPTTADSGTLAVPDWPGHVPGQPTLRRGPTTQPPVGARDRVARMADRERFAQHQKDPACAGCHTRIDGLGNAFEQFDAIGAFRTEERPAGLTVDTSGVVSAGLLTDVPETPVASSRELLELLSQHEDVHRCFASNLYRFSAAAHGRQIETQFLQLRDSLDVTARASVTELLVAYAGSDLFTQRATEGAN